MSAHRKNGFTLVEVLVAVAVLSVALIPAFNLASSALNLSASIRNTLIASHLAQEGVEVVRAIRDANWFAGRPYDDGLNCATSYVQYDSSALLGCDIAPIPVINIDATSGMYQYGIGNPSLFRRIIRIKSVSSHELLVMSTVAWNDRMSNKTIEVEYHLFDWLQ